LKSFKYGKNKMMQGNLQQGGLTPMDLRLRGHQGDRRVLVGGGWLDSGCWFPNLLVLLISPHLIAICRDFLG
jgi:hypothetical protein